MSTTSTQDDGGGSEREGPARARRWWPILLAPVIVVLYAIGIVAVGVEDAVTALVTARPAAVVGALLLQVVVMAAWPLVHQASVMAVGERVSYLQALDVSMSAFTVSHTVPGGGTVGAGVAVERLTRFGIPGPAATASATLTGPVSLTTIMGLGTLGVIAAVVAGELPGVALLAAVLGLVLMGVLVGVIVSAIRSAEAGEKVIEWLSGRHWRLEQRADDWRAAWRTVTEQAPTAGNVGRIFAWSTCKWGADIASLALVFVAFGQTPRVTILLVGFFVAQGLANVPLSPGGLGLVEGGMIGAFVVLGLTLPVATTIVLTYRVLETWLPTLAGMPVLLRPARS